MPKIILNGIEYASGVDQTAFNKIGVEPLDVGTDLSNAVNVLDGRMISLTQQEYNNLPDSKLTNHVAYFITDSPSPAESALWDKVGSEELEIGDNCSDGINQLKQSLSLQKIAENIALSTTIDTKTITSINGAFEVWLLGKVNSTFRGSLSIPYSVFKAGYACYIPCIGGNVSATIYVEYVSDTQIKCSTSNATFNYLDIYVKKQ